jgi:uncharacterized protein
VNGSPVWSKWPGPVGALAVHEPAVTSSPAPNASVVVVSHAFPPDKGPGLVPSSLVAMSDRLASDLRLRVVACCLRGIGESEGEFSLRGWMDDLEAVISTAAASAPSGGALVVGAGASGSLAISIAAKDERVKGVACLATPSSFGEWAADPRAAEARAIELGILGAKSDDAGLAKWAAAFTEINPLADAERLSGRPVLIVHGTDDDVVAVDDARRIADAVGGSAELRLLAAAGHRLNSDPRAVALILGWLERQGT